MEYDAIVIGSGPNGLAAAITLAQAGLSVLIVEASETPGGGIKTESLTLAGFHHDVCSSIHPLAMASPFFRGVNANVQWIFPDIAVAHPLDNARSAWIGESLAASSETLGKDGGAYRDLMEPFVENWEPLLDDILQPLIHPPRLPVMLTRFGTKALRSADGFSRHYFKGDAARSLFAGLAAHSFLSLREPASAAIGLVLGILGHAVGWPMPQGGSGKIAEALLNIFLGLGGKIETGRRVANIDELPAARAMLCDISPRALVTIAGHRLPTSYRRAIQDFRHGPGVFKIDYALSAPIPWMAPPCRRAGTVHVGGTLEEIGEAEEQVTRGQAPDRPFVLVAQHSLFDSTRAPQGKHTAWTYCHVPNGSTVDMTSRIEAQIERFAPGFRDCILARSVFNSQTLESRNPNLIGGDINGGRANLWQLVARPVFRLVPYRTPVKGLYLCSASTPPGGGVHGMCGYNAARDALKVVFGK